MSKNPRSKDSKVFNVNKDTKIKDKIKLQKFASNLGIKAEAAGEAIKNDMNKVTKKDIFKFKKAAINAFKKGLTGQ